MSSTTGCPLDLQQKSSSHVVAVLAWTPLLLCAAAMAVFWVLGSEHSYESPLLLLILNSLFTTATSALIALLAAQTFLVRGHPALLMLFAAMTIWGASALIAVIGNHVGNYNITIHNMGVAASSVCHLAGALLVFRSSRCLRCVGPLLSIAAFASLLVVGLIWMATLESWLPVFFIDGKGGTPLRTAVLIASVCSFGLASLIMLLIQRRNGSEFLRFYALGLALIALGGFGLAIQVIHGSALGWTARSAQYLGGVYMFIGTLFAIRESRAWQLPLDALLDRAREAHRLLDLTHDAIIVRDPDDLIVYWNRGAREMYGYSRDEALGQRCHDLLRTRFPLPVDELAQIIRRDGRWSGSLVHTCRDGRDIWVDSRWALDLNARRETAYVLEINNNVTDRKRTEDALRDNEARLRQLNNSLEQRVAERTAALEEQASRLRRLAAEVNSAEQRERKRLASILHDDLQQILVAAKLGVNTLAASTDLQKIHAGLQHVLSLLEESIDTSRNLTRGLRPAVLYEAGLVDAFNGLAAEMHQRYKLAVHVAGHLRPDAVEDDVKPIVYQSVRELLFNVAKHASVPEAHIAVTEADHLVTIVVSDEGRGFDPATAEHAADGFGLFSVRERLAAVGARMQIESQPGRGSRITITLPTRSHTAAQIVIKPDPLAPINPPPAQPPRDERIRVLIVDDHAIVRDGIAMIVNSDARTRVVAQAADGIEALEVVQQHRPDVVLLDLNMPRMNGLEAAREFRRRWPEIKIIGLSVQEDDITARSMLDAGATAFVPKASSPERLVATIIGIMTPATAPQ